MFRDLERGHFVALGPALSRRPLPVRIGDVETSGAQRSVQAHAAARDSPRKRPATSSSRPARTKSCPADATPAAAPPPPPATNDLLAQLARSRPPAAEPPPSMTEESKAEREAAARQHPARDPGRSGSCVPHRCGSLSGLPGPLPHPPRGRRAAESAGLPPPLGGGPRRRRCGHRRGLRMGPRHDLRGGSRRRISRVSTCCLPAPRWRHPLPARRRNRPRPAAAARPVAPAASSPIWKAATSW